MPIRQVDPISLLKESISKQQKISLKNNTLHFPNNILLPLNTKTAWISSNENKQYSLGDLWLYLDSKADSMDDRLYFTRLTQMKKELDLRVVAVADRGGLTRKR